MSKQHFYIIHADAGQMQQTVEGPGLKEYLNMLSRRIAALNLLDKSLTSVKGDTKVYYPFKYGAYTNKGNLSSMVMFVHGNKGTHKLSRKTDYRSIFLGDKDDIVGEKFFDYIFGTEYPSEVLLRTGSEEAIIEQVQKQVEAAENANAGLTQLKDKELICRLLAKLYEIQLANPASRFVILLPAENISGCSEELLKQLYAVIPPALRAEFGFATNVSSEDISALILPDTAKGCDLPIHVFTMAKTDGTTYPDMIGTYPIAYFDAENYLQEEVKPEYVDMARQWVGFLGNTFESKMAYVERLVLGNRSRTSFSNLEPEVKKMASPDTFFWQGEAPKSVAELAANCKGQKELLKNPQLKAEIDEKWLTEWAGALSDEIVQSIYKGTQQEELDVLKHAFYLDKFYDALDKGLSGAYQEGVDFQSDKDKADVEAAVKDLAAERVAHSEDLEQYKQKMDSLKAAHQQDLMSLKIEHQNELKLQEEKCQQDIQAEQTKYTDMVTKWNKYADDMEAKYKSDLEKLNEDWNKQTAEIQEAYHNAEQIKQKALDDQAARFKAEWEKQENDFKLEKEKLKEKINGLQSALAGGDSEKAKAIGKMRNDNLVLEKKAKDLLQELDTREKKSSEVQKSLHGRIVSLQDELAEKDREYHLFEKKHDDMVCSINFSLLIKPLLAIFAGVLIGLVFSPKTATTGIQMNGPEDATYSWQIQEGNAEPLEVQADENGIVTISTEVGKKDRNYLCEVTVPEKIAEVKVETPVEPDLEKNAGFTDGLPFIGNGANAYCVEIRPGATKTPVSLSIGNGEKDAVYRLQSLTERGWSDVMGGSGMVVTFTPSGSDEEVYRCIVIP